MNILAISCEGIYAAEAIFDHSGSCVIKIYYDCSVFYVEFNDFRSSPFALNMTLVGSL